MATMKFMLASSGAIAVFAMLSGLVGARRVMSPSYVAPYRAIMEVALGITLCAIAGILAVLFAAE